MDDINKTKAQNIINVLKAIDKRDYKTARVILKHDKLNSAGDGYSTYENNFVAKFNEQYGILISKGTLPEHGTLQRQLQIPKKYIYSDQNDPEVEFGYNKLEKLYGHEVGKEFEFTTIPDFFIHKDEMDKEEHNQEMILEFKTELDLPEKRFAWDLFKLNLYIEKFNYQFGGFICLNNPKKKIEDYLLNYIKNRNYLTKKKDRVFIFIQEDSDSEIEYDTLDMFAYNKGIKL